MRHHLPGYAEGYWTINLTSVLLGGSSTGSDVITNLSCHFLSYKAVNKIQFQTILKPATGITFVIFLILTIIFYLNLHIGNGSRCNNLRFRTMCACIYLKWILNYLPLFAVLDLCFLEASLFRTLNIHNMPLLDFRSLYLNKRFRFKLHLCSRNRPFKSIRSQV